MKKSEKEAVVDNDRMWCLNEKKYKRRIRSWKCARNYNKVSFKL